VKFSPYFFIDLLVVREKAISDCKLWCKYPVSTLRIHNVAVWLLFDQIHFLRAN